MLDGRSARTRKALVAGGVVLAHVLAISIALLARWSQAPEEAIAETFMMMIDASPDRPMSPVAAESKTPAVQLQMLAPKIQDLHVEPLEIEVPLTEPVESPMMADVSPASAPVTAQADAGLAGDEPDSTGRAGSGDGLVLRQRAMPGYPLAAMRRGEQGVTAVLIHVTESGAVDDVKVERSSGSKLLDKAAVDAFRKWRFDRLAPGAAPRGRWLRTAQRFVLYAFTYSRLDAEAVNSMYAEHLKPKPGTDDEMTPGVQQALAGFMAAVRDGTFPIQDDKLRPAFAELRATLGKWGAVKSVRFSGLAGSNRWTKHWSAPLAGATRREVEVSWNMFEVAHENATSEWLIAVDRDGGVWAVRAGQASWK